MIGVTIVSFSPVFNAFQLKVLHKSGRFDPVSRQVHHQTIEFI
jgi:hypothetical protein